MIMAAVAGVRALLRLHQSGTLLRNFVLIPLQLRSIYLPRRLNSSDAKDCEPNVRATAENESLLEYLNLLGVDVKKARQRQPGVLRRAFTNEKGVTEFLLGKGASRIVVAGIISRYPRSITRSIEHLNQRWDLWRNIFETDEEIVNILDRSPESFFRSSDNENLEKNIAFLTSLGLETKDLHRLLTTAPRTFSNSVELNRQMVELLEDICAQLGGKNPEHFAKAVITRNVYLLIRSTKRVSQNVEILRAYLELSDSEFLRLLQGQGAEILDLSSEYLKRNFKSLKEKMISLGCQEADIKKLITTYPMALYIGPDTLRAKLDCLVQGGVTMKLILDKPKVLDYSTKNMSERLEALNAVGYNFERNGISILDSSRKRFSAKLEKLSAHLC